MESVDARAQVRGRRQHGLITRAQLADAGVSPRTIARRTAAGRWREPLPSVIDLRTHRSSWMQSLWAVLLAAGERSWASHWTAAYLHGFLDVARPPTLDVLVPRGRHPVVGGVRLHTTVSLEHDEVTVLDAVRVTSPARTLLDLAAGCSLPDLERFALDLERRSPGTARRAVAFARRRRGAPGRRRLLDVVARLPADAAKIESPLEVRGVHCLMRMGLPTPVLQYEVHERGELIKRVDAAWPSLRVVVEFDGAAYHDVSAQRMVDERQRRRLRECGWEVVVLRSDDVREPDRSSSLRRLHAVVT
jgi:hypothetical protein